MTLVMHKRSAVLKFCIFIFLWPGGFPAVWAVSDGVKDLLNTPGLEHAAIGISVKEVNRGTTVVDYRSEIALTPASVTKLIPTWLALQKKGKDFRYRTDVFYTGQLKEGHLEGDIVLVAVGDPTPDSRFFPEYSLMNSFFKAVQKTGIRQIAGRILIEKNFPETDIPGSWVWEDISNYYGALYGPFNYRDNTYVLEFASGRAGTPVRLKTVRPALPDIRLVNEVYASAENRDDAWIFGGPYSRVLYVKGSIPQNRASFPVKGGMHNPDLFFIREMTERLQEEGIALEDKVFPQGERKMLLSLVSPRLEEIVYCTNKSSVNLFAEALGKLVATELWPEKAVEMLEKSGVPATGTILKDACGLSPLNAAPAQVFTDLLVEAARKNDTAFIRSLPVAGTDAGLNGYCRTSPLLKKHLQAKTGSMSGVRCLSGYLTTTEGKTLAFTILINHYTCPSADLQCAVGKFLQSLMD